MTRVVPTSDVGPKVPLEVNAADEVLVLDHTLFCLVWVCVVVGHVACAAVLLVFALLYLFLGRPDTSYYASFLNSDPPNLQLFAIPMMLLAGMHGYLVLGIFVKSFKRQSLSFASLRWLQHHSCFGKQTKAVLRRASSRWEGLGSSTLRDHKKQNLFTAIFGVSSPLFDTLHMAREAIEVACQVNQAHWASFLVSQRYLNHVLVLILVLNAWSTPLIHCIQACRKRFSKRDVLVARLIMLLVDALLNSVSCMAIPLLLVVPFWRDFDFQEMVIPVNLEYDDVYFARVVTEMQIVAAGTWLGLGARLVPHAAILSCLVVVSQLAISSSSIPCRERNSENTERRTFVSWPSISGISTQSEQRRPWLQYLHFGVDFCFVVVGIIVLAVHLSAHVFIHRFSNDQSCDLVSAPWFATKFPCLVYNFDCAVWNQTSAHSGDLAFLEPGALVTLNFVHCSALEVPNDLRMFRNIIGINLKHVTLVDWPRTTAVDPAFHPVMMFVVFSYVKLPSVPAGILGPLPAMLQDIEFSHTNLSVIPEDLGEHWRDLNTLYFEYSQIHEIPRSLMSISFNTLSLIGNYIEDASVLEWLPMSVGDVALDFNPLKIMPYRIDAADISIFRFGAQDTLVANVSDELLANVKEMFMRQTPYCDVTSIDHLLPGINCQDNLWLSTGRCQSD